MDATARVLHVVTGGYMLPLLLVALVGVLAVWRVLPARLFHGRCGQRASQSWWGSRGRRGAHVRTMAVLGSGGHTAEMVTLLRALDVTSDASPYHRRFSFAVAKTDTTSRKRVAAAKIIPHDAAFVVIPRAREVGESWASTVASTLRALAYTCSVMWGPNRPDLLLTNGPGTCVPLCVWAALLRVVPFCRHTTVVYVESVCRVTHLSLAGKILYYVADVFLVQWPQLKSRYPQAEYMGLLV